MPATLVKGARCWKCGKGLVCVTRTIHGATGRATVEFHHDEDVELWRAGRKPEPCTVRMSSDESDRAIKGLPRLGSASR